MEQEQNETYIHPAAEQEPTIPSRPRGPILTLPIAIVIAGVLIGGSVIYSNVRTNNGTANIAGATKTYTISDVKKWAKSIKLDAKQFNQCLDSGKYAQHVQDDLKSGTDLNVQGTPSSFINGVVIGKSIFVEGALPYDMFDKIVNQYKALDKKAVAQNVSEVKEAVVRPDDHTLGKQDAPITIIEYSDFQCPYCEMFFTQTLPEIKKNMVDTGKVQFIFRNFPLSQLHPMAEKFAEAAECAGDQGKFWEMHDTIFTNQAE